MECRRMEIKWTKGEHENVDVFILRGIKGDFPFFDKEYSN